MNFLMDTNVNLDAYLMRQPWYAEVAAIVQLNLSGKATGFVLASSITDTFYILRKQLPQTLAVDVIKLILQDFEICPVDKPLLISASKMPGPDFEDNVQIACAIKMQLDCIVTRDQKGFLQSPVPVFSPAEFLVHVKVP